MVNNFIVQIKNGKIKWKSQHHRDLFDKFLLQMNDGAYNLSLEQKKSKRSDDQNRYYWLFLGVVSEDTGYFPEEIHEWAKGKFLTKELKEIFGEKTRIKSSTTKLTRGEFVEYLMKISIETGVALPDTTEFFGYSYHK